MRRENNTITCATLSGQVKCGGTVPRVGLRIRNPTLGFVTQSRWDRGLSPLPNRHILKSKSVSFHNRATFFIVCNIVKNSYLPSSPLASPCSRLHAFPRSQVNLPHLFDRLFHRSFHIVLHPHLDRDCSFIINFLQNPCQTSVHRVRLLPVC